MHHSTNAFVEFGDDADTATGMVKFLCVHPDGVVTSGDYEDVYRRTDQGWRIWRRTSRILTDGRASRTASHLTQSDEDVLRP